MSEAINWTGGGGFRFYRLGADTFDADGHIADGIAFDTLAAHIWMTETDRPFEREAERSPVLGTHGGIAYALLYNGILGDRAVNGGNVLTSALLARLRAGLPDHQGPWVIYGEASRLGSARLKAEGVTFRQTPYDVKAR